MAEEARRDAAEYTPLRWQDLLPQYASVDMLGKLSWWYAGDEQATQMIMAELERRGVDPYA